MIKKLRLPFFALPVIILMTSCIKKSSPKEVQDNLKTAMELYLNHQPRIDTSRVKFKVLEVTYFEAPKGYICEFRVNMKEKTPDLLRDTVGMMNANISKDFRDVTRR
jgi:hypothetical protein